MTLNLYALDLRDYSEFLEHYNVFLECLSDSETQNVERKKTQELKVHALGSKLLQRYAIWSATHTPLNEITIDIGEFNKPLNKSVQFNASHEDAIVVVATADSSVGVDITADKDQDDEFLEMILSKSELDQVKRTRPIMLAPVYWAAKEAFLKYSGGGLMTVNDLTTVQVRLADDFCEIYQSCRQPDHHLVWVQSTVEISMNDQPQPVHALLFRLAGLVGAIVTEHENTSLSASVVHVSPDMLLTAVKGSKVTNSRFDVGVLSPYP